MTKEDKDSAAWILHNTVDIKCCVSRFARRQTDHHANYSQADGVNSFAYPMALP